MTRKRRRRRRKEKKNFFLSSFLSLLFFTFFLTFIIIIEEKKTYIHLDLVIRLDLEIYSFLSRRLLPLDIDLLQWRFLFPLRYSNLTFQWHSTSNDATMDHWISLSAWDANKKKTNTCLFSREKK